MPYDKDTKSIGGVSKMIGSPKPGSRTRATMRARTAARWRAQGVAPDEIARRLADRDQRVKG